MVARQLDGTPEVPLGGVGVELGGTVARQEERAPKTVLDLGLRRAGRPGQLDGLAVVVREDPRMIFDALG